jgi:hypothetical protein
VLLVSVHVLSETFRNKNLSLKSLWIYFTAPMTGGIFAGIFNILNEKAMKSFNEISNEFEDEKHIFSFTTLEQFKEKIEFCINNPMIVNAMSIRAYEHLLSFHTTKKRAEYFLEIIHLNYKKDVFVNYNNIKNIKFNTISIFENQKFYLIKKIKNWKF